MSVIRYSAAELSSSLISDPSSVETHLADQFSRRGVHVSEGERRSWRSSLPALARDLSDAGLDQVEVVLEHRLPLTSKRADAILAGVHPRTGNHSFVVVELKQWSEAHLLEGDDTLVEVDGARYLSSHPSTQVAGYVQYLRDFSRAFERTPDQLQGVAYLHNATDVGVGDLLESTELEQAPMFTGQRRGQFIAYLQSLLAKDASGAEAADRLIGSRTAPSKQLMSVVAQEIREQEQFVLLDEQKLARDLVLHQVKKAVSADSKSVVVVTGGPGSGKSVIALSLMGELAREGRAAVHATGSRSFTETLRKVAGKGSTRTKALFKYFNNFMEAERNGLDVLILDEAHRIREKSVNQYTPKAVREKARPQINELLDAARVPVFLLDQHQVVRPGEMGTPDDIRRAAEAKGLEVRQIDLTDQFRSGGSLAYIAWVERLLGLRDIEDGPQPWDGAGENFEVDVVGSPDELESRLQAYRNTGYGARMAAGFCWPWSNPRDDGSLVPDVTIGTWQRPWNLRGERAVGGAPPASLWATDPAGFGQVGCVYTAQGFEYDWNGVILGPDLVWRQAADDGRGAWVVRRSESRDSALTKKSVTDARFDELTRNTYKVLLTRGMVGTLIYSTDEETREFLRSLMPAPGSAR
ncbi:DNA/RNA helicase domain-containing protein [Promicromonospora sp. MS192]|uniref:DNA/RNA helicase domain-containing protein n=1 Tax=Promicromonospora sp. MS192 TaxID=3412684 RepID=UPI003C2D7B60